MRLIIPTVLNRKTVFYKKRPPDRRRLFLLLHLFYNRKNEGHKSFGKANGFLFSYESGKTFAVSHFFVSFPVCFGRKTAFELAAIIIKRNVGEHKIKILSFFIRRKAFPCCRQLLTNCPFVEYIIAQQILQNQVATTEKTNENRC